MIQTLALVAVLAGTLLASHAAEVFPRESAWRFYKGFSNPSFPDATEWRHPDYDDSRWETSPAPFYYGEPLDGTPLPDMRGQYTSVFFRKTFDIADPNAISQLNLDFISDDGLIIWINGQEVRRFNMPGGDIPYDGTSLSALSEPIPWENQVIENARELLVQGRNVVAVHGFNSSINSSSDFVFDASLSSVIDEQAPFLASIAPLDRALVRALRNIEVFFNEDVTGVDAGDLLINGQPATNVTAFAKDQYVFDFPEPAIGAVQVAFAPNHAIRDLSPAGNPFAGAEWSYTFDPDAPLPGIIISEFMADNDQTLRDEDGDNSDWIELFNATESAADLTGWFLSDDTNNLAKWKFPGVSIPANGYLVVFASEKNRTSPARQLHTNFRLGSDGEFLGLSGPRTNLVSSFAPAYPAQEEDISYGRERSNPNIAGYFPKPTPGAPNTVGGAGFAPEVQFSREGGTFSGSITLTLQTSSSNAVIRYVIGTDLPTETSPVYSGPINISNTAQVRARAFEPGLLPGRPRSEQYVLLAQSVVNFTSDLPIIILHNYGGGGVPAGGDQFVMMEVFEPKNGVASMTNAPDLAVRARFKKRGSSTEGYPKASFAFEAWDEYDDDLKIEFLGMPEESDWVFYAPNNFEPILTHNPFAYALSREIGQYAPRTRFAEVYLNTAGGAIQQGNYNGIYVIEEKIKRSPDRVDIDKLQPEHLQEPEISGGYLLKIDRSDPGDYPFYAGNQAINYVDPKGEDIRTPARAAQEAYIASYFDQMAASLYNDNPATGYPRYIDVPSWIDHHLLNVLMFNVDALRLSTYFYKPRGGKVVFGPVWDFDRALGSTDGRDSNPRVWRSQTSDRGTDFFNYPWWGELFSNIDFWQRYVDRWQELRQTGFSTTNMFRLLDELTGEVTNAQPRERARWGIQPRGGTYASEISFSKTWLRNRAEWIDDQFLQRPAANIAFGIVSNQTVVTLTAAAGSTIYYTLDGSDPRSPGGNLAPGARRYTAPITIDRNVRLFARARNLNHENLTGPDNPPLSTPWSGNLTGTYAIEVPPLAITEIMFSPSPVSSGIQYTNQDFEFIELKNIGTEPIDLGGASFTKGISFTFPSSTLNPGDRIVVVRNRTVFESRYGTAARIAGEFSGSLDNNGEQLFLEGPMGEPIADFRYESTWQPMTDGLGFALVLKDESIPFDDYGVPGSWTRGSRVNGSPGSAESAPVESPRIFVNEALTHTDPPNLDAVELYNPLSEAADVSGWYLSDDFGTPKKSRLPSGSIIADGGYLVLDETLFNQGETAFSLGADGDDIYLFSADDAGELTGYYHGFEFGAAPTGVTFGRYVSSDASEHFVAQVAPTLGAANAAPKIGPIVISEIMFQPPPAGTNDNTLDEFIELYNPGSMAIELFDPANPNNTWHLAGGVDFVFPAGITLPAGGLLLLVNFDPVFDQSASTALRTKYAVPTGVLLYGPYSGKLSNTGEKVSLRRPDAPPANGTGDVPYIVVDEVDYSASGAWPADSGGSGNSLQRLGASFANDPASWVAALPTAGRASDLPDNPDRDNDGLPNDWETANNLDPDDAAGENGANGDPDQDGLTNLQEWLSGTKPRDASSVLAFASVTVDPAGRRLSFMAAPGKSYSILYRTNLVEGPWEKLSDHPASEGGLIEVADSSDNPARYYHLVTPAR